MKLSLRVRPADTGFAFCDEAYSTHRYFVLGGVLFAVKQPSDPEKVRKNVEANLEKIKSRHALGTVKWSKVPTSPGKKLDGYKALIEYFFKTKMQFKCMIVDTQTNPLDNRTLWGGDALIGYLKFYCVFLADGFMSRFPGFFYQITIDGYTFRRGNDCATLERSIEGRYVRKSNPAPAFSHCKLETSSEEESNLLQLTDVLLGAVGFAWNDGMARTSKRASTRQEIVNLLEQKLGFKLSGATPWSAHKFNLWLLKPKPVVAKN